MGINELPSPPLLVEPKPEGRASRVRGGGGGVSGRPGLEMPIHTHPPPWRRSSNACTAGKSKAFQSHRTGGVAILALGRRPRTRKARSELISPISPAYPAALDSLLLRYLPGTASGVTTRSTPTESTRCFPIAWTVHGQLGRLPSAKHGCPPGLGPLPGSPSPTYQASSPSKQVLLFGFVVRFCWLGSVG